MSSTYFPYALENLRGFAMLKQKGINVVDETPIQCLQPWVFLISVVDRTVYPNIYLCS